MLAEEPYLKKEENLRIKHRVKLSQGSPRHMT